jgi:hypothetical protein
MNELSILSESVLAAELAYRRKVLAVSARRPTRRFRRAAR